MKANGEDEDGAVWLYDWPQDPRLCLRWRSLQLVREVLSQLS